MQPCHRQASVAAARWMWAANVDSTATSRGVCGEPGRPAGINKALGRRKKPPHCKDRSAARATEGVRESSFLAPRCRVRVDTCGTSRRRRREVGCRRAEGPSVEQLALPADCPGPRSWVRPGEAWRWRMGVGVREARGLRTFVGRGAVRILADGRGMCTRGVECCGATYCRGDGTGNGSRTTTKRRRRSRDG